MTPSPALPVNRVELSMPQLAGMHKLVNDYSCGLMTTEYYRYACQSVCGQQLKEFHHNELVVARPYRVTED